MKSGKGKDQGWMATAPWSKAIRQSADPGRVKHFFVSLADTEAAEFLRRADAEQARIVASLLAGSEAMGEWLATHPDGVSPLTPENLAHGRQRQGLRREVQEWLQPGLRSQDYGGTLNRLRRFRQQEMCRIAARDLARLSDVVDITREISHVADICLEALYDIEWLRWTERFGVPHHLNAAGDWVPTGFAVLGLGKLGGQELNYSSDVDLMFLYDEEGCVFKEKPKSGEKPPGRAMTNHQFFQRLAEGYVQEATANSGEGFLYRVDLRLRPEGDAGPLVRSIASCENYYAQWGQIWERMMLIKARCVAGQVNTAGEFLETVQSFRYPRYLSDRALREMAAMKQRTEDEVVRSGELDRNVKLGRGGIREIEFIAQTAQILNAGRNPFLQGGQTLPTLEKMVQYNLLKEDDARQLRQAYVFFRDVEHRLQMDRNQQTHSIPSGKAARERLARLMECRDAAAFETVRKKHADRVRRIYRRQIQDKGDQAQMEWPRDMQQHKEVWVQILRRHGFQSPEQSLKVLREFVQGPGYVHVSARTSDLAWELVPRILGLCPQDKAGTPGRKRKKAGRAQGERQSRAGKGGKGETAYDAGSKRLSDPDRILARLDRFMASYGARAGLIEIWTHQPSYLELLLLTFDRSEFLAEMAIRVPDLIDDLVQSGRLTRLKSAEETLEDLRFGLKDKDQLHWIRKYHQAELMRIGLRDILGLSSFEENVGELSGLADACLQYALEVVMRRHRLKSSPFAIVGLGKLGGREINFGSDLDILFVTREGPEKLPEMEHWARETMELLSRRTEDGLPFETDARLRPDGEKSLLVNTLGAFEDYYRNRAQLWEIQAVSRTRPIAGDRIAGQQFQTLVHALTNFTPENVQGGFVSETFAPRTKGKGTKKKQSRKDVSSGESQAAKGLACYSEDWKAQIARMRARIEKERTAAGRDALAIKTGAGGLMDAEFLAQAICLEQGWQEPNTLNVLEAARETQLLPKTKIDRLIGSYRELRRLEGILRRWSLEGETELPQDPQAYRRVAIRCGFSDGPDLSAALQRWRKDLREVYHAYFPEEGTSEAWPQTKG